MTYPVWADELRIDGLPLEQALDLPKGSGGERIQPSGTIYIGDLPDNAARHDVRAAFGRLDVGEIGAYLAAAISGKTVTGTATYQQTLLLLEYASLGGGEKGKNALKIKALRQSILDSIHFEGRTKLWF